VELVPAAAEDRSERLEKAWEALTGDPVLHTSPTDSGTARAPAGQDKATEHVIRAMSADDMAKWVPAFNSDTYDDEQFDAFWNYTARHAGGQAALLNLAGGSADAGSAFAPPPMDGMTTEGGD
jgi:hypothetical protein